MQGLPISRRDCLLQLLCEGPFISVTVGPLHARRRRCIQRQIDNATIKSGGVLLCAVMSYFVEDRFHLLLFVTHRQTGEKTFFYRNRDRENADDRSYDDNIVSVQSVFGHLKRLLEHF